MNVNEWQSKIELLDEKIKKNIFDSTGDSLPISDGIVDVDKYLSAKYKIL